MSTPVTDMLEGLKKDRVMFAMPGHKGRLDLTDITEIDGADNLLHPSGCIMESQKMAARLNSAAHAMYSTNGSSACTSAMIGYFGRGAKVIAARDFHISAKNAMELYGTRPVYVGLKDMCKPVRTEEIVQAIEEHPDAAGVYVTSPNYYGRCADLTTLAALCRRRGMLLAVDGAHGAHHPFSPLLPVSPGEAGADLWCASCHKTLPAKNQAAVLFCGDRVDERRLKRRLAAVHTTSPSYPILISIEQAYDEMEQEGAAMTEKQQAMIGRFLEKVDGLPGIAAEQTDDFTRIVLNVSGRGLTGFEAERHLSGAGIYAEAADEDRLILISTVADREADFARLAGALKELPQAGGRGGRAVYALEKGEAGEPSWEQTVFAYPPGVPIVLKGQRRTEKQERMIAQMRNKGYNLLEW